MEKLTEEQQKWAIQQVERWLKHCPYPVDASFVPMSGLLPRLMSGLEPLPKAPPLIEGKPCYALYEGKSIALSGAPKKEQERYTDYPLVIEDRADYRWVDEKAGLVEFRGGDIFKVWHGECETQTVYGGERYLENRWQMRLWERKEVVVIEEPARRRAVPARAVPTDRIVRREEARWGGTGFIRVDNPAGMGNPVFWTGALGHAVAPPVAPQNPPPDDEEIAAIMHLDEAEEDAEDDA